MVFRKFVRLVTLFFVAGLSGSSARADDLTTNNGNIYKDYKVIAHDEHGITISYTGTLKIAFEDLPVEVQKKFGHDPNALTAQQAAIKAREAAAAEEETRLEASLQAQYEQLDARLNALKTKAAADYAAAPKTTISGQVFIAAQGGENIHFAGIHVGLIPIDLIQAWLPVTQSRVTAELHLLQPRVDLAKKEEEAALKAREEAVGTDRFNAMLENEAETSGALRKWLSRRDYYAGGQFYLDELLPYHMSGATTELNGKFTLTAPANSDFALVAKVDSILGSLTQSHYWFIKVHPTGPNTYILLDSENQSSSTAADSLLHTEAPDTDAGTR